MRNANKDLQASYQIIQLIERSKNNSELVIERLPDVFLVLDRRGRIFKANEEACRFLGLSSEQALGFSFKDAVLPEQWRLIEAGFNNGSREPRSFEFNMIKQGTERVFLWSLSFFGSFETDLQLFTLQGRDITLLRLYQKKINDIFASIPLGIFTVNNSGLIDDAFSEYTKWMLGQNEISGRSLKDVLYEPAKELMDVATREGFKAILDSVGRNLKEFDVLSETFPKQFYFPLPHSISDKGRFLGIKVQSIARSEKVIGLLVVLEDRTAIVEAEKADERHQLLQDLSIERALQLKKADPDILDVSLQDLHKLFTDLGDAVMTQSSQDFKNLLHTVKANARLVGLSNLQKLAHSFESKLKEQPQFSWEVVYTNLEILLSEWREIIALNKVLHSSENELRLNSDSVGSKPSQSLWALYKKAESDPSARAHLEETLKAYSRVRLGSIEAMVRGAALKTAEPAGKRVRLLFDWDQDLSLDQNLVSDLRSCLVHLVTNAIDHGLESPLERNGKGKSPTGIVRVGSIQSKDGLIVYIEDDGKGVDLEGIKIKALDQGLVSREQLNIASENDILDLVFYSGFSTKENVSETSGRGVGLSAVRDICMNYGGNCKLIRTKSGLTRFELHFVTQE